MKTLNLFVRKGFEKSINGFADFEIPNKKLNFIKGGSEPIQPDPKQVNEWLPDEPK